MTTEDLIRQMREALISSYRIGLCQLDAVKAADEFLSANTQTSTTDHTTPPERFYKKAQELVDLINRRRHQPAYASDISDVAHALWAQFERGKMDC